MWRQIEITLSPKTRGFHLVTDEILSRIDSLNLFHIGMMNIFIQHTSASLTINENADPTFARILKGISVVSYLKMSHILNTFKHTLEDGEELVND